MDSVALEHYICAVVHEAAISNLAVSSATPAKLGNEQDEPRRETLIFHIDIGIPTRTLNAVFR